MSTFPHDCYLSGALHGPQPSPTYPPPPRWLYKLMAADLRGLLWTEPHLFMPDKHWRVAFKELHKEHPHMRPLVIHALSGESRSPLMSCTVDLKSAQKMIHMVGSSSHPKRLGPIVRMDPNKIGLDNIIDMSTELAQTTFFHNTLETWGEYVRENRGVRLQYVPFSMVRPWSCGVPRST